MTRILVTGLGIVSAAGHGLSATAAALRAGRSGLGPLTRFASPRCGHFPVAEVAPRPRPDDDGGAQAGDAQADGEQAGDAQADGAPRTLQLARTAMGQALRHAGLDPATPATGLALGTCVAGMPETENAIAVAIAARRPTDAPTDAPADESVWARHECGFVTAELARSFGIDGPVTTLSAACSSSAQAIATAAELLQDGAAERMIAGGADALSRLTLNGFAALLNVSPTGCRPFDAGRDGMSLGEGAAFLILERSDHLRPNARPLAELCGWGNTCDAHHATAPDPDGRGAEAAMVAALATAGIDPRAVDYVNAHGTGTVENDRAEGRALGRLFGRNGVAIASTKRVFGHTLGAAGAIEAVACVLSMRDRFIPASAGLRTIDPECCVVPLAATAARAPRVVLSNSFAFGGNNSSLCLRAVEAPA